MVYRIPAYASAVLLLLAVGDWPYGFYTFLRIAVCLTAVYGAVQAFSTGAAGWGVALAAIGILFNPIIPVYLSQAAWAPIDVVCAGLIGASPHYLPLDARSSNNSPSSPR